MEHDMTYYLIAPKGTYMGPVWDVNGGSGNP